MAKEVFIIGDQGSVASLLSKNLSRKGFDIKVLKREDALTLARRQKPSLLIAEIASAGEHALEECRLLRDATSVPMIALVESPGEMEEIDGVEYLSKPPDIQELMTAVDGALKRRRRRTRPVRYMRVGDFVLDLTTQTLTCGDQQHRLTLKECQLMKAFMSNPGRVLSHKKLMQEVWQTEYVGDRGTLYVHVSWLREKIEQAPGAPVYLRTVRGVGYRFDTKP